MNKFGRSVRVSRVASVAAVGAACFALANCAGNNVAQRTTPQQPDAASNEQPSEEPAKPPKRQTSAAQKPAVVQSGSYSAVGVASWYGADFHGRRTANGETFNMNSLTAAHRTLPLQCTVKVTNLANNRSLFVRVNDRGPFAGDRIIDLSAQSARLLGFYDRGLAKVKVELVNRTAQPSTPQVTASAM